MIGPAWSRAGPYSGCVNQDTNSPEGTDQSRAKQDVNVPTLDDFKKLGPAGFLALAWAFVPALGSIVLFWYMNSIGEYLRSHGNQGIGIYIACFAFLAGFGLMPTYASAILGGWAFGFAIGFPAALVGFVTAALIGRAIAKPTAKDRVESLIAEKPKWKAVRDALIGGTAVKTFLIVTMLRLPPNSPFAITNFVLSATRVPLLTYVFATLIGMAPRTGAVLYIASTLQNKMASDAAKTRPDWLLEIGIGAMIVVLVVLWHIGDQAIRKLTAGPQQQPEA